MALADGVSFIAASGGTGNFVFGAARNSFLTLAQAQTNGVLVDGQTVSYLAQDSLSDPGQREWGHGTYSQGSNCVVRSTVYGGTSGVGVLVNFVTAPVVSLTVLAEDLFQIAGLPANQSSNGSPLQFAFDSSGNLYICYATNTWAKYTNVAPFTNGTFSDPIPVIF